MRPHLFNYNIKYNVMQGKCWNCKIELLDYDKFMWKDLLYCSIICSKIHWRFPNFIDKKVYHTYSEDKSIRITHLKI